MITSLQNPMVKEVARAIRRGTLTRDGYAVAEGFRLVSEALRSGCELGAILVAQSVRKTLEERVPELRGGSLVIVADNVFQKIASTENPQGVMALVRPPMWVLGDLFARRTPVIVLDGVQEPGNAGAVLRVAEAFGAGGCIFLKGTVDPYNPKAIRASAGSVFRLPLVVGIGVGELELAVKARSWPMFAAMPRDGVPLDGADLKGSFVLVLGSEAHGVSDELAQLATPLTIPTTEVESLNIAVAAGVILYEAWRQRQRSGPKILAEHTRQ